MKPQRKPFIVLSACLLGTLVACASCGYRGTVTTGGNSNASMLQPPANSVPKIEVSQPKSVVFDELIKAAYSQTLQEEHVVPVGASERLGDVDQCVWWWLPDKKIPPSNQALPCRRIALCDDEKYGCRIAIDAIIWTSDEGLVGCLELQKDKTSFRERFTVELLAANMQMSHAATEGDRPVLSGTITVRFRGPDTDEHCSASCHIPLGQAKSIKKNRPTMEEPPEE